MYICGYIVLHYIIYIPSTYRVDIVSQISGSSQSQLCTLHLHLWATLFSLLFQVTQLFAELRQLQHGHGLPRAEKMRKKKHLVKLKIMWKYME